MAMGPFLGHAVKGQPKKKVAMLVEFEEDHDNYLSEDGGTDSALVASCARTSTTLEAYSSQEGTTARAI